MGRTLIFLLLVLLAYVPKAQDYVSTEPTNRNAIIEIFTGVACSNCPEGHAIIAELLATFSGRAFTVFYHPSNSSYTTPYPNDPDLRRDYPNAFYDVPYCGEQRFMPGAFINRKIWDNGDRLQSREIWEHLADSVLALPSPLNIGMVSSYDCISKYLHVTVEIYYTSEVTDPIRIYVLLNENHLRTQQSGIVGFYSHMHTFRTALCGQWGEAVPGPALQGDLQTMSFSCYFPDQEYLPGNCEIITFVENEATGEVINGTGTALGSATYIPPAAGFIVDKPFIAAGEQAVFRDVSSGGPVMWEWTFEGGIPPTSSLSAPLPVRYDHPGNFNVELIVTNPAGCDTILKEGFVIVSPTGTQEHAENGNLRIYPNPSSGLLHINAPAMNSVELVMIRDLSGKTVFSQRTAEKVFSVDLGMLEPGIYLVEVYDSGKKSVQKVLIN